MVIGAFADYEFHDAGIFGKAMRDRRDTKNFVVGTDTFERTVDLNNAWAIGARIGMARSCCTLWYLNAGYTQAELESRFRINGADVSGARKDNRHDGWFWGGGVEQQLGRGFSLALEYRYATYDSKESFNGQYAMGGVTSWHQEELDPVVHTVRLGVNYKFDIHGAREAVAEPMK